MPQTRKISNTVGPMLKSRKEKKYVTEEVPRSIARNTAPVLLSKRERERGGVGVRAWERERKALVQTVSHGTRVINCAHVQMHVEKLSFERERTQRQTLSHVDWRTLPLRSDPIPLERCYVEGRWESHQTASQRCPWSYLQYMRETIKERQTRRITYANGVSTLAALPHIRKKRDKTTLWKGRGRGVWVERDGQGQK